MYCFGSMILPLCLSNSKISLWGVMYYSSRIFNLYPFSGAILFTCLGAMVVELYDSAAIQLMENSNRYGQLTATIWKVKLIQLKNHCFLIAELVNQINKCFSVFFLIFVTSQFGRMITQSFHLATNVWKHDWFTSAGVFVQLLVDFIHFFILVYTCYYIRQKV